METITLFCLILILLGIHVFLLAMILSGVYRIAQNQVYIYKAYREQHKELALLLSQNHKE